jgi:uncharacterized protein YcaQ
MRRLGSIDRVRSRAVAWSLRASPDLAAAMADCEFVQCDPIRSPARAQDLILLQRVAGYRVGDLDRAYPLLGLDEDYLYAYSVVVRRLRPLLHPRASRRRPTGLAANVLAFVREAGVAHPREVAARFGRERARNDWGGSSAVTTLALDSLHHHGFLRVARREGGVRLYAPATPLGRRLDPARRLGELVQRVARTLAPVQEASLGATVSRLARSLQGIGGRTAVRRLCASGQLSASEVDGVRYVWPVELEPTSAAGIEVDTEDRVRFLSPFDPLVWDRRRFEHLWGWAYRFEAYTPVAKRQLGYYAMPLLWREHVIGWVNCGRTAAERLSVQTGFVDARPRERAFRAALDEETARLETFLQPDEVAPGGR